MVCRSFANKHLNGHEYKLIYFCAMKLDEVLLPQETNSISVVQHRSKIGFETFRIEHRENMENPITFNALKWKACNENVTMTKFDLI